MSVVWKPHPVYPEPEYLGDLPDGRMRFRLMEYRGSVRNLQPVEFDWTAADLSNYWTQREQWIANEKADPLRYGYELPHWKDADRLLEETRTLCLFGGNRAGKTEYIIKRAAQMLATRPGINVLLLQNNELASKQGHQRKMWHYLPPEWKNLRKSDGGNIRYDPKNGFSDNLFVTPLEGTCLFGNYEQHPEKFEGLEFDFLGPDENYPLIWFHNMKRGLATRNGLFVWGFTPIAGITQAIAEVTAGAATRESRPVDPRLFDPTERRVDDCPVGHMPYIAEKGKIRIMYFHSEMNPFGGYDRLVEEYGDEPKEKRERRFYGFSRKTVRTKFPRFSEHNIVSRERMAELLKGRSVTWYHVADPAGERNMFQIWVAVDQDRRHFVVWEWPDLETYGEWAVPSENPRKFDGDEGPAQPTLGWNVVEYKRMILEREGWVWGPDGWNDSKALAIEERIIDPRSGVAPVISERSGGESLVDRFENEQVARSGLIEGPSMVFAVAPGYAEDKGLDGAEGVQGINELLAWDMAEPMVPFLNEPKLFVSEACGNVIWAMQNYTGHDGGKAACKDPIDCLRYMATSDLQYVDPKRSFSRGGSY